MSTIRHLDIDLDFGRALLSLKTGCKITRRAWANYDTYLHFIHEPRNQILLHTKDNKDKRWDPNQEDILAHDWELIV